MRSVKRLFLVGLIVLLAGNSVAAKTYQEIDTKGVKALMDANDALVIFPLSPIEFDNRHIAGSVNITMGALESALPKDKERKLIFYCLGVKCVASWRAAEKAAELGYQNVYAFRDGIPAWEKAGYPLASNAKLPDVAVKKISTSDLAYLSGQKDVVLLDINMEKDANTFYIDHPGRVHISLDELNTSLHKIPKDKRVVVICLKGERSPTAVRYLIGQGYKDVAMIDGGVQKWILEGRAVKKAD